LLSQGASGQKMTRKDEIKRKTSKKRNLAEKRRVSLCWCEKKVTVERFQAARRETPGGERGGG